MALKEKVKTALDETRLLFSGLFVQPLMLRRRKR
jgi:hypothetical protein